MDYRSVGILQFGVLRGRRILKCLGFFKPRVGISGLAGIPLPTDARLDKVAAEARR
jgi:hypothetical protein